MLQPYEYYNLYDSLTLMSDNGVINKKQLKEYMNKMGLFLTTLEDGTEAWEPENQNYKMVMSRPLSEVKGCCGQGCCASNFGSIAAPYETETYVGC